MLRIVLPFWIAVALFAVFVDSSFLLGLAGYAFAFALFALSIQLMLGGLGEVPLGQSLFYGLGAYAVAILMLRAGLPYVAAIALAMLLAAALAWVIGLVTLKLTGAYFAIVSWGIAGGAVVAALNLDRWTGGPLGLFGFPDFRIGPLDLAQPRTYFLASAAVLGVALLVLDLVKRSPFGAAMESVRQNRHLAQAVGIDPQRQRLKVFVLSAPFAALAGALAVPYLNIVSPDILSVAITVDGLLMVLICGTATLVGPVIGACIFTVLPYLLHIDPNLKIIVFSMAIVLILFAAPGGLHELALRAMGRTRRTR